MKFGDKLKHIRTEKKLTQPQLSAIIGIEQSYLSKLENDKSQPSADMFSNIIKALELPPADFLHGIDRKVLQTSLHHIPEVSHYLAGSVVRRVHDTKKWLFGAAAACALGFALMLAANDGIVSPNNRYTYVSKGVILADESDHVFDQFKDILKLRLAAGAISGAEQARMLAEFEASRVRQATVEVWGDQGSVFFEAAGTGRRKFELTGVRHQHAPVNKVLQYLGALFTFCGVLAIPVEWRLRRANAVIKGDV